MVKLTDEIKVNMQLLYNYIIDIELHPALGLLIAIQNCFTEQLLKADCKWKAL